MSLFDSEDVEIFEMSKRKPIPQREGPIWKLSSIEATLQVKPRYNGFACGHGAHGDAKYNRSKELARFRAQMESDYRQA